MINYKFCPQCKTNLKRTEEYFYCKSCGIKIYPHSSPTSSILPIKNGKVLLAKRAIEPFKGQYDVVGGFLKNGEDPVTGIIRETKEETGLEIKILDLLGIYMDTYGASGENTLNITYVGEVTGGKMIAQDDVASLEWIEIDKLPNTAFENQKKAFEDLKRWCKRNPNSGRGGQN